MVNKDFLADFRRMTGKEYSGCLTDTLQILVRHNLRYIAICGGIGDTVLKQLSFESSNYTSFLGNTVLR